MKIGKYNIQVMAITVGSILGCALLIGSALVGTPSAQRRMYMQGSDPVPVPEPKPHGFYLHDEKKSKETKETNPLAITPEERKANEAIMAEFAPYQQKLGEYWQQILSTSQDDDAKVLNLVLKAKLVNAEAAAKINPKLNAWFKKAQDDHKCPGCDLQDWVFIPKPMAGGTAPPTTSPAKP
jgi:hypothetical protein